MKRVLHAIGALVALGLGVRPAAAAAVPSVADLGRDLTFYVPFDGAAAPSRAGGAREVRTGAAEYAPGRVGHGVRLLQSPAQGWHPGNLDAAQGTVAFWVQPAWGPQDGEARSRTLFRCKWLSVTYDYGKQVLFFMTGAVHPPEGFRWDYNVAAAEARQWALGEWHHVAITWDARQQRKALFLDGRCAASGTTEWLSPDNGGNDTLALGLSAPGTYDEWAIWKRELAPAEVAALAAVPDAAAQALAACADVPGQTPEPVWPLVFSIPTITPPVDAIVEPSQPFTAVLPVANPGPTAFAGEALFILLDWHDRPRAEQRQRLALAAEGQQRVTVTFTAPAERGPYKIAVRLATATGTLERDVSAFAVWPVPKGPPVVDSFFGNHVNSWYGGAYIRQAARLGLGWVRGHDMLQATWWGQVQPEPGPFAWLNADAIAEYRRLGMPILGTLSGTPWWATADGPKAKQGPGRGYASPPDLALWRVYCEQTLRRYSADIRHWEIYNEPEVSVFWNGTPEQHAAVVRIACEVARQVDPALVLMASGYTAPSWHWHEAAAKAGAWRDLDVLSVHLGAFGVPEISEAQVVRHLDHFRDLLERYGPGRDTPIWSTEGGVDDTTWFRGLDFPGLPPEHLRRPLNAREGAIRVVQGSALLQAHGVRRHFIYLHNLPGRGAGAYENTSMIDINNAPRPKLMARVAMAEQTDGCVVGGAVSRPEAGRFRAFAYGRADDTTTVLWWCGDEGQVEVPWPGPVTAVLDLMGNAVPPTDAAVVTGEPGYVHIAAAPEAVLGVLRAVGPRVLREPSPLPASGASAADKPALPVLPEFP